jgi:hypothetical protein
VDDAPADAAGAGRVTVALTVYGRSYCHLCDEMIAGLRTLQARFAFSLAIVDVDEDDALEARYGEDTPVLAHGEHELCRHRLDARRVTEYLAKIG